MLGAHAPFIFSNVVPKIGDALRALGKDLNKASLKAAIRRVDDDDTGTLRYRECVGLGCCTRRRAMGRLCG